MMIHCDGSTAVPVSLHLDAKSNGLILRGRCESALGTERQKSMSAHMCAMGCEPDSLCSPRAFPNLTPCRHQRLGGIAGSLRLDAGEFDHLGPFLGFVGDELAEVGRRERNRRAAQVVKPRPDLGIGKASSPRRSAGVLCRCRRRGPLKIYS